MYVFLACFFSLGVLFVFKYFNFFNSSIFAFLNYFSVPMHPITLKLILPVGISFYTFQTLSYVIDIYMGDVVAEHNFGVYATFVSFFPQLVAGPIERTNNLLPQIKKIHVFDYDQSTYGLKLFFWGLYKKIVVADTLAVYVDLIYNNVYDYKGLSLIIATVFFTLQIYCDFSGYSDMAIGVAKMLNIDLMTNFNTPYLSSSLHEFWSRWHISLSTWFKDYVYIPLGGNKVSAVRNKFNLIVTFLLSGLWHGANWTFIIWGGIHGIGQVIENLIFDRKKIRNRKGIVKVFFTILTFIFVSFAWIFFRSNNLNEAMYLINNMFYGSRNIGHYISVSYIELGFDNFTLLALLIIIGILALFELANQKRNILGNISNKNKIFRWTVYVSVVLIVIFLSEKGGAKDFVYFQF